MCTKVGIDSLLFLYLHILLIKFLNLCISADSIEDLKLERRDCSMEGEKIFIPMSIDQNSTTRAGYFFSPFKSFIMIGGFIPGVPWVMYAYSSSGDNIWGLVIGLVTFLIAHFYLVRFVVFEERRLKKMMRTLDENKRSGVDHFWGIDEIEDDGVIRYKYSLGLRKAVIVKVVRGSTVGVADDFKDRYKYSNLTFTRDLLRQRFGYMKYTKLERVDLPEGLRDYNARVAKIEDENVKRVLMLNLKTIANFTKEYKSVVVDYYVVSASDPKLLSSFKPLVHDIMTKAFGGEVYFRGTRILDKSEVVQFLNDTLYVKGVRADGYQAVENYSFGDFGSVFRAFDQVGREVMFDIENSSKPSKPVVLNGKRNETTLDDLLKQIEEEKENQVIEDSDDIIVMGDDDDEVEYVVVGDDEDLSKYMSDEYEIVEVDEDDVESAIDESEIDIFDLMDKKK